MSAYAGGLRCPVCGFETGEADWHQGCPQCRPGGRSVNLLPRYDLDRAEFESDETAPGLFKYRGLLPLPAGVAPVSLGEGGTPLIPLDGLAAELGVGRFLLKDETRNPTWSYKDRLAAVAVTKAKHEGADTVVVASTGNHGAAAAAYAAAAGLRCVALTVASVPLTMKVLMQVYGAAVAAIEDLEGRWTVMRAGVRERGWVPVSGFADPPAGSNPWGVDGYKTIAYELFDDLGAAPDVVVVPTAYGDGLVGIFRGFLDLVKLGRADRVPQMVAVDPFGAYAAGLAEGRPVWMERRPSVAFSIATPIATEQGLVAIRESGGTAVEVGDDTEIMAAQHRLASTGIYLEASAAISLPAVRRLAEEGRVGPATTVVAIGTATGLKDVGATADMLPEVPVIEATLEALDEVIATR